MSAFITWQPKAGPARALFFDVVTEEVQEKTSTATEHPVEDGADVSDHVKRELDRVTLTVVMSNHPIIDVNNRGSAVEKVPLKFAKYKPPALSNLNNAASNLNPYAALGKAKAAVGQLLAGNREYSAQVLKFRDSFDAVAETLAVFELLQEKTQLVDVILPSRDYTNMHLEKVGVTRNAALGDAAQFTLEFKQIRKVEAKLVTAPVPTEVRGQPVKKKGAQPPADVPEASPDKSVAKSAYDLIKARLRGGG